MTKNQKIALGCGGVGCLGLIVLAVGCVLFYWFVQRSATPLGTHRSINFNSNRSVDGNSNATNSSSTTPSSSMSDDDKHKLFQAASMTGDTDLVHRAGIKIGILNADFSPTDEYPSFVKDHIVWAIRNTDFMQTINTQDKAKAYVDEHIEE